MKGEKTAEFLRESLKKQGLNAAEINEFIIYWLPQMEDNPYNIIAFQTEKYTESARLIVSPAPDTIIRVFMTWFPSDRPVDMPPQALSAPSRVGKTVVEWGGVRVE